MIDENNTTNSETNNEPPKAETSFVENNDTPTESAQPNTESETLKDVKEVKEPATTSTVAESKTQPKEKKPPPSSRFSGMVNFSGEKGRIVTAIIENGIEQGYWKTKQQFYDKVFDFAINSQLVHAHLNVSDAYIFGVPDDVETKLFTNGYYENDSKLNLPIC
ncbi:hypothetical protein ACFOW1_09575 [Parasediminibacterium paludis]|uniref:Uncharacterized protein n=1 Tax=Parasediminibacterium paludis TaxID=908966 RepID=A0ABV8PXX3_9BACT